MNRQSALLLSSILFLSVLFIQLQNPAPSFSGEDIRQAADVNNAISDQSSGGAILGQIRTKERILIIRTSFEGQRYTVQSKDGDLLAVDISLKELDAKFPELKEVVEKGIAGNDASLRLDKHIRIKSGSVDR